ncbi:hypothetical protein ABIA24_005016 [Sinorhizobium fredii]
MRNMVNGRSLVFQKLVHSISRSAVCSRAGRFKPIRSKFGEE